MPRLCVKNLQHNSASRLYLKAAPVDLQGSSEASNRCGYTRAKDKSCLEDYARISIGSDTRYQLLKMHNSENIDTQWDDMPGEEAWHSRTNFS
eukprot:1154462-Pelagomonas_calceolata.AAC.4